MLTQSDIIIIIIPTLSAAAAAGLLRGTALAVGVGLHFPGEEGHQELAADLLLQYGSVLLALVAGGHQRWVQQARQPTEREEGSLTLSLRTHNSSLEGATKLTFAPFCSS